MDVHLIDGTYELFRHFYALPSRSDSNGDEVAALTGVLFSVLSMVRSGATHIGVATDHVIESFRNEMYSGYKTGEGIEPALFRQFHPLEDALRAMGVVVWAMVDQEADDALAAAALRAHTAPGVGRVYICTPDKDLAQCILGEAVVQLDRRSGTVRDERGVHEKFGVAPQSIPDYLALVGDSADGFPGVPQWGARSAATLLAHYEKLERIPRGAGEWAVAVRGAARLAESLRDHWTDALLFRELATLRTDADVFNDVDELTWHGPTNEFRPLCEHLGTPELAVEAARLSGKVS